MKKRERQREFIERHSAPLVSFAEAAYMQCGRGAIFIRWPEGKSEDWVYLAEKELQVCLSEIMFTPEETEGEELARALSGYDPSWEAVIVFLNDIERRVDLHRVGFIPVDPRGSLLAYPARSSTNH